MFNSSKLRAHRGFLPEGSSFNRATIGFLDFGDFNSSAVLVKFCLYLLNKQDDIQISNLRQNSLQINNLFQSRLVYNASRRNNLNVSVLVEICEF